LSDIHGFQKPPIACPKIKNVTKHIINKLFQLGRRQNGRVGFAERPDE
jgi:hypothetical protein